MSRGRKDSTYFEFDETRFVDPVFCTFLIPNEIKDFDRAIALTLAGNEEMKDMIAVTIVECFGERVDIIYHMIFINSQ
jgi:hypothetical protein